MENEAVTKFASQRRGPGLRGRAVPVRVHHDRLRRAVGLPLADRLRDDAEDGPEGVADPHDRLRRDADGVLRRGLRDHRRVDHRPGPLLRDERPGRRSSATRSSPPRRRSASSASRSRRASCRRRRTRSTSRRWSPARAAPRRWRSACRRSSRASSATASRRSSTTSRSCSRRCSSSPRSTPGRASGASCSRTRSATSGSRSGASRGSPALWLTSAIVVGAWGYFLYTGVTNPLGGINQLFPLFGIANQLLAAVALAVCTTLLIKHGKLKWAWVTGIPLAWDAIVTLDASYQKVFSVQPEDRLLRAAQHVPGGDRRRQGAAAGQEHGRHAPGRDELDRRRRAGGAVCRHDHHRAARLGPHLVAGHRVQAAPGDHRGAVRGVHAVGPVRAHPDRGGARVHGEPAHRGDGVGGHRARAGRRGGRE